MSLFVSYEVGKRGALEKQLDGVFEQRFEDDTLKRWKRKKWMPRPSAAACLADATFALGDGRCSFTLPVSLEEAEPLRAHLLSKKAKALEFRLATAEDIVENRRREVAYALQKGPAAVSTNESLSVGGSDQPWEVTHLFTRDEAPPPYELIAFEDELIGVNVHERGPQLHVLACTFDPDTTIERTISNLPAPMASLTGLSLGPDGVLYVGGAFVLKGADYTAVHVSSDRGRTWTATESPSLTTILGGTGLATTCWFEDMLWVANEKGVARRRDGTWEAIALPSEHVPDYIGTMHRHSYQAGRLVVVDDNLYYLGKGIARFDREAFITELEPPAGHFGGTIESLLTTTEGTLIAGGSVLWRKARGATWDRVSDEAFGIDPSKPKPGPGILDPSISFPGLHLVGGRIVLVANKHHPHEQIHLVYVSKDDGKSCRPIPIPTGGGALVRSSSVLDPKGGVVIAGFGGAVLRVEPPR